MEASASLAWVDPNFFSLLPVPVLAGDPVAALARPDGVVLTRAMARKFFGRDAPIGETLELKTEPTTTPVARSFDSAADAEGEGNCPPCLRGTEE